MDGFANRGLCSIEEFLIDISHHEGPSGFDDGGAERDGHAQQGGQGSRSQLRHHQVQATQLQVLRC